MILLMGGTKDARSLLALLSHTFPATMIVATAVSGHGARLLREQGGCVVLERAMDAAELAAFIRDKEVRVLLDATHPFAVNASNHARQAAAETGIPYICYERPPLDIPPGDGVYFAPDFRTAAQVAARLGQTLFLTIGTRHLADVLGALPPEKKVVARVLPDVQSIAHCLELGLTPAEIVALQGPVSEELNRALFAEYKADVVVSKDSGETGGTPEKVAAARKMRLPVVLVRRPVSGTGTSSHGEILSSLRRILG